MICISVNLREKLAVVCFGQLFEIIWWSSLVHTLCIWYHLLLKNGAQNRISLLNTAADEFLTCFQLYLVQPLSQLKFFSVFISQDHVKRAVKSKKD